MSPHTLTGAVTGYTLDSSIKISIALTHNNLTEASSNIEWFSKQLRNESIFIYP